MNYLDRMGSKSPLATNSAKPPTSVRWNMIKAKKDMNVLASTVGLSAAVSSGVTVIQKDTKGRETVGASVIFVNAETCAPEKVNEEVHIYDYSN